MASCHLPLDPADPNTDPCIKACLGRADAQFVCDISAQWMHHVSTSVDGDWYPATPPKRTGIHQYVAYRYYEREGDQQSPPPCNANGYCPGCGADTIENDRNAQELCRVSIDPETCSIVSCDGDNNRHEQNAVPKGSNNRSKGSRSTYFSTVLSVMGIAGLTMGYGVPPSNSARLRKNKSIRFYKYSISFL